MTNLRGDSESSYLQMIGRENIKTALPCLAGLVPLVLLREPKSPVFNARRIFTKSTLGCQCKRQSFISCEVLSEVCRGPELLRYR